MPAGWLEIDILQAGAELSVIGRGSQGEQIAQYPLGPSITPAIVRQFAEWVQEAASAAQSLESVVPNAQALDHARALHQAIFQGDLRDLLTRLQTEAKDQPIMVRFMPQSAELQAIPWEALCKPGTTMDFLGTSQKVSLVRGVHSTQPWKPQPVKEAVRVLVISPSDEGAPERLRQALRPGIEAGEISWITPLTGSMARAGAVLDRLRYKPVPHILHFIGHGDVDSQGAPRLRMADVEGEQSWLRAELLAQELGGLFLDSLRLIILEACKGAQPGTLASAAELLARSGADAVVAHLWPVKADVARRCSAAFYGSLTSAAARTGDVVRSLHNARRTILGAFHESAEAFSPVLYLRGNDSTLFDFQDRKTRPQNAPALADPGAAAASAANEVQNLLRKPCSLLLGDTGAPHLLEDFRQALFNKLAETTPRNVLESLSLSALAQRYALSHGAEAVTSQFQARLRNAAATMPLIDALAKRLGPGVHITLLRSPLLEEALVRHQPHVPLYVIQPSRSDDDSVTILPHTQEQGWGMPLTSLESFDPRREIAVLRLYRGYLPTGVFGSPLITEDDYLQEVRDLDALLPGGLATTIKSVLDYRPALLLGMSLLSWDHRHLLNRLFDARPLPQDSVALLEPGNTEGESWKVGRGLPGRKRVRPIQVGFAELGQCLEALPLPGGVP